MSEKWALKYTVRLLKHVNINIRKLRMKQSHQNVHLLIFHIKNTRHSILIQPASCNTVYIMYNNIYLQYYLATATSYVRIPLEHFVLAFTFSDNLDVLTGTLFV